MTALDEIRATRFFTDVREKLMAWETELQALPEGIGTAVAEALEDNAQRHQAHVRALHQAHTAWRKVQERHVAALCTATDTLHRLIALNEALVRHTRRAYYRRMLLFVSGVLVGAAITGGAFVSAVRSTLPPALHDAPSHTPPPAAPEHHAQRHPRGTPPWRTV